MKIIFYSIFYVATWVVTTAIREFLPSPTLSWTIIILRLYSDARHEKIHSANLPNLHSKLTQKYFRFSKWSSNSIRLRESEKFHFVLAYPKKKKIYIQFHVIFFSFGYTNVCLLIFLIIFSFFTTIQYFLTWITHKTYGLYFINLNLFSYIFKIEIRV